MKDYVNVMPKSKQKKQTQMPKMWEVFTMMLIGCASGMLFLAWLGLL